MKLALSRAAWIAGIAALLFPASALAQIVSGANAAANGQSDPQALNLPAVNIPQPNSNLTPAQWQSMIQLRALQSRGRGQVRTGIPQDIPLGQPGMQFPQMDAQPEHAPDAARKSSLDKRIAGRKAAEEKKRAARDAAKAKAKDKAKDKDKDKDAKPRKVAGAKPKAAAADALAK